MQLYKHIRPDQSLLDARAKLKNSLNYIKYFVEVGRFEPVDGSLASLARPAPSIRVSIVFLKFIPITAVIVA
jgi:hypothetical protein